MVVSILVMSYEILLSYKFSHYLVVHRGLFFSSYLVVIPSSVVVNGSVQTSSLDWFPFSCLATIAGQKVALISLDFWLSCVRLMLVPFNSFKNLLLFFRLVIWIAFYAYCQLKSIRIRIFADFFWNISNLRKTQNAV